MVKTKLKKGVLLILVCILCLTFYLFLLKIEDRKNGYINLSLNEEIYIYNTLKNEPIYIKYPQLFYDENTNLDKINLSLKNAMIEWVNDSCEWASELNIENFTINKNLLSVLYHAKLKSLNNEFEINNFYVAIIIDLKTGERILLNDIVDCEVLTKKYLKGEIENVDSTMINSDDLYNCIKYASMSELEYLNYAENKIDIYAKKFPSSYLMRKPIVYLEDDKIVITRGNYLQNDIRISFNDFYNKNY